MIEKLKKIKELRIPYRKIGIVFLITSLVILFFCCFFVLAYPQIYKNKIYPGVQIDNINLSGLSVEQATKVIGGKFKDTYDKGFVFQVKEEANIKEETIINKQELADEVFVDILSIYPKEVAEQAFNYGREGNFITDIWQVNKALILKNKIDFKYNLNKDLLLEKLENKFKSLENPAQEAHLEIDFSNNKKDFEIKVTQEQPGNSFNYQEKINELELGIKYFENKPLMLDLKYKQPLIKKVEAEKLIPEIEALLENEEIVLFYEEDDWKIKRYDFSQWLDFKINDEKEIYIGIDWEKAKVRFTGLSQEINQESKDAKFQMKNNRVTEFQASQTGLELNLEMTYKKIEKDFIQDNDVKVELVVEVTQPEINLESINDLGIKEMIGVGTSNFYGSPANRRHNIGVGTATVNGVLIKPGQEFSTMQTLGAINAQNGYLPELVIKGNETIPEYGGGLCQVGTTLFRVAVNAGLPITERKSHAYRVIYYEPAGFDATLYEPHPDLRFVNDTGHYLLLQAKVLGNVLRYELWGTNDGRKVTVTKPVIYNITPPGPTKLIETTELKPGQKKCTESAHNGADAYFKRSIITADGETKEKTWASHYVPWQAVCMIGVEATTNDETPKGQAIINNDELDQKNDDLVDEGQELENDIVDDEIILEE